MFHLLGPTEMLSVLDVSARRMILRMIKRRALDVDNARQDCLVHIKQALGHF